MLLLSVFRAKRLNTLNREMKRRILKSEFNLLLYIFLYIFYFSRDIFIMGVIFFFSWSDKRGRNMRKIKRNPRYERNNNNNIGNRRE